MTSTKTTYDPQLRKTEHGRRIYAYWRRIRKHDVSPEFEAFPGFYFWAMKNKYTIGAKLFKYEPDEPYAPDNCFWVPQSERIEIPTARPLDREMAKKWDETVNRIRLHYGMEPIHSSEV